MGPAERASGGDRAGAGPVRRAAAGWCLAALVTTSVAVWAEPPQGGEKTVQQPQASEPPHESLPHLLQHTPRIYSGGEPVGNEAFTALAQLGVRTLVSVDGIRPDVETAQTHGLRYVHIPIGYDGISERAGRSLANLVKTAPGPFYIHCHHGKHRGPAAAAVCCIADRAMDGQEAVQVLSRAGTSRSYEGLWQAVRGYRPPADDQPLPALVAVAEVGSLAAAMAVIDRAWDRLQLCRDAGWRAPPDHADLVPEQEALLIEESFHEAIRKSEAAGADEPRLRRWMRRSEQEAAGLKESLAAGDADTAAEHMRELKAQCQRCHEALRH